ncbi:MAG: hypothetical protein Q9164_001135 [Protoblastenia rupestris]
MGNVGVFVAHSLAGLPNRPPLTLLFKGHEQLWRWNEVDATLKLTTHGTTENRKGFDVEIQRRRPRDALPSEQESPDSSRTANSTIPSLLVPELRDSASVASVLHNLSGKGPESASRQDNVPSRNHILVLPEVDDKNLPHTESDTQRLFSADYLTDQDKIKKEHQQLEDGYQDASVQEQNEVIYHLIVATKAPRTAKAVQSWAHRLTPQSTILFLQNGMGVIDEVNEQVFPDPEFRPQYMVGVNSHGLKSRGAFDVVHVGEGSIALGIMPQLVTPGSEPVQSLGQAPPSSRYLLRTMTRTPVFVAVGFTPTDLLQHQLDKLAINSIINPLTAILGCQNGGLIYSFNITRVMRLLLAEIGLVIRSLPELQNVPNVNMRFDTLRLERLVVSIAELTSNNDSSMLQDTKAARQTEIDYINGYIVKRGEELGLHCVLNYMLMHMIKAKGTLISRDERGILPFPGSLKKPRN